MKVICPYCHKVVEKDPFDTEEGILLNDKIASLTQEYTCEHCGKWFTRWIDGDLVNIKERYFEREV